MVIAVGLESFTAHILIFFIRKESIRESASVEEAFALFAITEHSTHPRVMATPDREELALYRIVLLNTG